MRKLICLLALLIMGMAAFQEEGVDVAVEAFMTRAGVTAEAVPEEKVAAFVESRGLTPRIIGMMDPGLLRRYGEYLAADRPIDYSHLLTGEAIPLSRAGDLSGLRQVAVLRPEGAATASMLSDFEVGMVYYDETRPLPQDVCRAQQAVTLTPELRERLLKILAAADLSGWSQDYEGQVGEGLCLLALYFDEGVVRYTAASLSDAPEAFGETLDELLIAARDSK